MRSSRQNLKLPSSEIKSGLFSKPEGAEAIISGVRHVHSSLLGLNDPCLKITEINLQGSRTPYPWEFCSSVQTAQLTDSTKRSDFFEAICASTQFAKKSQNRDRLSLVCEEILTNAFYHSYKDSKGNDKYDRLSSLHLPPGEAVSVSFKESNNGLHLVVTDQGGTLEFANFQKCFRRCFDHSGRNIQMEEKHSGAGLGLFLLFEMATHLSIFVSRGKRTRISLWLASTQQYDADMYSFNFFEE